MVPLPLPGDLIYASIAWHSRCFPEECDVRRVRSCFFFGVNQTRLWCINSHICFNITGHAKLTGPGDYGDLRVPFVIHAVGPCYCDYDELSEGDALLASAYRESLEQAHSAKLEQVAFSLLSAGVYRGEQTLHNVLLIGIETILEWTQQQHDEKESSLTQVYMCGFNARECNALLDICEDDLKLEAVHEHEANDSMAAEDEEETNNDACVNGDATDDKSECTNDDSADGTTKETKEETMNDAADAAAGKENGSNGVQEKQRDL